MNRKAASIVIIFWVFIFCNSIIACSLGNSTPIQIVTQTQDTTNKFFWKQINYDSSKQYIYLTFDDGPSNGTVSVFDLCKQLGVKASFFMVGGQALTKNSKDIVNMVRNEYPQILLCNHSFSHANSKYVYFYHHPEMAAADFYKSQLSLNVPFKIVRLPGNRAWIYQNEIKASDLVKPVCILLDNAGYNAIGWDIEWKFKHKNAHPIQTPEQMIAMVDSAFSRNETRTNNHIVILSHDRMFRDKNYTDSLAKFIMLLKQNSKYIFETVDHYPQLKPLQ